jgi:hypothetical protein
MKNKGSWELLITIALFCVLGPGGSAQEDSAKVYFGEVESKTDKSITLNVTPCRAEKMLQQISPYKITGSQKVSCGDGKTYERVNVQEEHQATKATDKKDRGVQNAADKKKEEDSTPKTVEGAKPKSSKPEPSQPSDNDKKHP